MSLHFLNSYVHYRINTLVMIPIRTRCENVWVNEGQERVSHVPRVPSSQDDELRNDWSRSTQLTAGG